MSVICAVNRPGEGTWFACDSRVNSGGVILPSTIQKWLHGNKCAIGVTGMGTLLTALADHSHEMDAEWSGTTLWSWIRETVGLHGIPFSEDGEVPSLQGSGLFVTPYTVVSFCSSGSMAHIDPGRVMAEGSGGAYAISAAHVLQAMNPDIHPTDLLDKAVQAAIDFDAYCGGKKQIYHLSAETGELTSFGG